MTSLTTERAVEPDPHHAARLRPVLAARRFRADHDTLLRVVEGRTDFELAAAYRICGERAGTYCDSLHDLIAHVLMWDEMALGVLMDASRGRTHWLLDPEYDSPAVRTQLDWSGVAAGRHLPAWLLLHRLVTTRDALTRELAAVGERVWAGPAGSVVEAALTADGAPAFWHAAHHLKQLPYDESFVGTTRDFQREREDR